MTTLTFGDLLVANPFRSMNYLDYSILEPTNIFCNTEQVKEIPFVMMQKNYHPGQELHYSGSRRQFEGRLLTTQKIKEIMDIAKIPIISRLGDIDYLFGKGFLGRLEGESVKLLFVATVEKTAAVTDIRQVKFYVSRDVYSAEYKRVNPVIRDFINGHPGDVVITSWIDKYIGHSMKFPSFKTLKEKKDFADSLANACIDMERKIATEVNAKVEEKTGGVHKDLQAILDRFRTSNR